MSLPVALQLYSVRRELEQDFEATIQNVAEMGSYGMEEAFETDCSRGNFLEIHPR